MFQNQRLWFDRIYRSEKRQAKFPFTKLYKTIGLDQKKKRPSKLDDLFILIEYNQS